MQKVCSRCFKEKDHSEFAIDKRNKSELKSYCKKCANKPHIVFKEYNADSIRVLKEEEVNDKFGHWAKAAELSYQYRKPEEVIVMALEACRRSNTPIQYYIDRHLKQPMGEYDKSIPINTLFADAYNEILKEEREFNQRIRNPKREEAA